MKKLEIQYKIDILINKRNDYEREKRQYRDSLSSANKLVGSIVKSTKTLTSASDALKKGFQINGKVVGGTQIDNIRGDISRMQTKVSGTIIPEINRKIRELESKIASINSEISYLRNELYYAKD